jgi:hypothetical protein
MLSQFHEMFSVEKEKKLLIGPKHYFSEFAIEKEILIKKS